MEKKFSYLKLILIGILLILIQSFLQQYETSGDIIGKYIGYLSPIIYAFFTALFLEPVVNSIQKKLKTKRWIAVSITVIFVLFLLIGFFSLVVPQIIDSIKDLYSKLPYMQDQASLLINKGLTYLKTKGLILFESTDIEQNLVNLIKNNLGKLQKIGVSAFVNAFWWLIALTKIFIGFLLGILILLDKKYFITTLQNIISILFGKANCDGIINFLDRSRKMMLQYIGGRVIVSFIVAAITLSITAIAGVPYALLTAMMFLVGNMIPYVGSILAGAIAIFLVITADPQKIIFLLVAIAVAQTVDSWVIGPKIVSDSVGIRSFWVIIAIMIGGSLFGPIGMFFGVPVLCMIKLIYELILEKKNIVSHSKEDQ